MHSLFRLSKQFLGEYPIAYPHIPHNFMTKNGYEDNVTERVCFSSSIEGCLMALSQNCKGKSFFVYVPNVDDFTLSQMMVFPTKQQVPDVDLTSEIWILKPIPLELHSCILVTEPIRRGLTYTYGNGKKATLYKWRYQTTWTNVKGEITNVSKKG